MINSLTLIIIVALLILVRILAFHNLRILGACDCDRARAIRGLTISEVFATSILVFLSIIYLNLSVVSEILIGCIVSCISGPMLLIFIECIPDIKLWFYYNFTRKGKEENIRIEEESKIIAEDMRRKWDMEEKHNNFFQEEYKEYLERTKNSR